MFGILAFAKVSGDSTSEKLMAEDATAAAKGATGHPEPFLNRGG